MKRFQTLTCFMSIFLAAMMMVSLVERALLVKRFYNIEENAYSILREFRRNYGVNQCLLKVSGP